MNSMPCLSSSLKWSPILFKEIVLTEESHLNPIATFEPTFSTTTDEVEDVVESGWLLALPSASQGDCRKLRLDCMVRYLVPMREYVSPHLTELVF